MRVPREVLFAGAAAGSILAVGGVAVVGAAWIYPCRLVSTLGATVTPQDLVESFQVQLLGTIAGVAAVAAGLAAVLGCFRALARDEERLRGRSRRP